MRTAFIPFVAFGIIWMAATALLFNVDNATGILALATAGYAAILAGIALWLLPTPASAARDDVFRFNGPPLLQAGRITVACLALIWVSVWGLAFSGIRMKSIAVPILTNTVIAASHVRTPLRGGIIPLLNFTGFALIPLLLLLLLRTKPKQVGLCRSAPGTGPALSAALLLPGAMCIVSLYQGGVSVTRLGWIVLSNLLGNGFSEEFESRGLNMATLRVGMNNYWALVVQAILFALPHTGSTLADYPGHPFLAVVNVVALNAPIGLSLGFMALRSRSLILPSIVHCSLDVMAQLVGTH